MFKMIEASPFETGSGCGAVGRAFTSEPEIRSSNPDVRNIILSTIAKMKI